MKPSKTPWQSARVPSCPSLRSSTWCDVLVVGGGITGLTAAYLLKKAGRRVCVLERDRLVHGDTGCTTAHLTYVTDNGLSSLAAAFGKDTARAIWQGGAAAIHTIEGIARTENIDCEFARVPGFLHASLVKRRDETEMLRSEAKLASELGFEASYVESLPRIDKPAIRFANQAKFHPLKYLAGVAAAIQGDRSAVYERSEVTEFLDEPFGVRANGKIVECDYIVIATHVPLMGQTGLLSAAAFQTKLAPYSTYAIGARLPANTLPEACYWDTSDPYYYLRIDRQEKGDYAIFGGEDHKTGQVADYEERIARLGRRLREILPAAKVDRHWSGQVIETNDGLPYVGETAERQFVATGFSGNGLTLGTLAAMMACDSALGRDNPWKEVFRVDRKKLRGGTWDFLKENLDYPYYLVRDRLNGSEARSAREVKRGDGKVLIVDGQRVAASRDEDERLHMRSAICTHLGCIVHWNSAEQTWDCPCHGSRFRPTGEVAAGPAESPLEPVDVNGRTKGIAGTNGRNGRQPHRRSAAAKKDR